MYDNQISGGIKMYSEKDRKLNVEDLERGHKLNVMS